jgi:Glycosyltransferase family 87
MLRTRGETGAEVIHPAALSAAARLAFIAASFLVLAVTLVRWGLSIYSATHSIAGRYDFSTYYAAAYALRGNLHANIYDAGVLTQAGAATHVLVNPPLPYTYPPLFAIVLSPFTALSFRVISRAWLFGSAALWLAFCVPLAAEIRILLGNRLAAASPLHLSDAATTSRFLSLSSSASSASSASSPSFSAFSALGRVSHLRDDPAPLVALAAAAWLCLNFTPAIQTMLLGQINFLVLLPLVLIPWLTRHGHERWVGVMVALAAMLKFTPAILVVYLLLRRRWEAAVFAIISLVALAVVSIAIVGPGTFFAMLPQALQVGAGDASLGHNQALFAPLLTALAGSSVASAAQLLSRILLVALALGFGHILFRGSPYPLRRRQFEYPASRASEAGEGVSESAAYAVALCAMVLLSPTAWVHHYVWVLPASAIALGLTGASLIDAVRAGRAGWQIARFMVTLLASVALGYALPNAWDTQPHPAVTAVAGLHLWPLALEMRPLATLALVAILAAWISPAPPVAQQTDSKMA